MGTFRDANANRESTDYTMVKDFKNAKEGNPRVELSNGLYSCKVNLLNPLLDQDSHMLIITLHDQLFDLPSRVDPELG